MTEKLAVWPTVTDWAAGCVVMDGAVGGGFPLPVPPEPLVMWDEEQAIRPAATKVAARNAIVRGAKGQLLTGFSQVS